MKKCPKCGCMEFILAGDDYAYVEYFVSIVRGHWNDLTPSELQV